MPKLPPPPFSPQNRSAFSSGDALTDSPSAVTTSASRMLSALNPYLRPSQPHRGHDVLSSPRNDDQRRLLVGVEVEGPPSLIVAVLARRIGGTLQACSELFDRRSIYSRHPNLRSRA